VAIDVLSTIVYLVLLIVAVRLNLGLVGVVGAQVFYTLFMNLALVMATAGGWQSTKVGAGPTPIETSEGWLLIYHGVLNSCNGFVYHAGAALLHLDQPWKVICRTAPYILSPQTLYECVGDVPNVVFPCAALADAATGRLAIYYGAADTTTCLAFARVDELIVYIRANPLSGTVTY
jgi:beta-1,4-mannooligosaccharide/beta-1,4-mannosyl-N-acetylglucosamine phosphorylase